MRGRRVAPALAALLALLVLAGAAGADEEAAFRAGARAVAEGRLVEAAAAFEALAAGAPDDPWADDALMEAALLYEGPLGQPERAVALYEELLARYASSRLARRAQRRIEVLRAGIGDDGEHAEALARYRDVMLRFRERGPMGSAQAMEALLDEAPEFPRAAEARLWIGRVYQQEGRLDEALAWYRAAQAAEAPSTALRWDARKAEADLLLQRGDLDPATAIFESLRGHDATRDRAIAHALAEVEVQRARLRWSRLAWVALALAVVALLGLFAHQAGTWRATLAAAVRPPLDLVFMVPVAAILAIATLTHNMLAARAVVTILSGAVLITWLSGAGLEAARRRAGRVSLGRALAHAILAALAIAAICYLSLMNERLLDLLAHTRRFGHN